MIPMCMRETVTFKDVDGIVWMFKPKTGAIEAEYMAVGMDAQLDFDSGKAIEGIAKHCAFFDSIVLGWSEAGGKMPNYPADKKPSVLFNGDERVEILSMWNRANTLTAEEKKS